MWQVEVPAIIAMWRSSAPAVFARALPRTPRAPAWASIRPQPTWHCGRQAEIGCGLRGEAAERGSDRACGGRQGGAAEQVVEADLGKEIGLPARGLVGEIGPLAGERADRALVRAAGPEGEVVREVQEAAVALPLRRQVALQPHELWDLHLGRHRAADEVQDLVAGGRAFLGLGECPVIEPEDDVPAVLAAGRDGGRAVVAVEGHERAGGIEADPGYGLGRQARLLARLARGRADRLPDVLARLFGVVGVRLVHPDRARGAGQHFAIGVEQRRPRAAGADVDRDHHLVSHRRHSPGFALPRDPV